MTNVINLAERRQQRDRLHALETDLATEMMLRHPGMAVHRLRSAIEHGWQLLKQGRDYAAAINGAIARTKPPQGAA